MTKKIILMAWIFFVFYLSGTSSIKVTDPSTWLNPSLYTDKVSLMDLLSRNTSFYWNYLYENKTWGSLNLEFYLRKLGHILLYASLSYIFWWNIQKTKYAFFIAWGMSLFVAFVDECNQYLMIGRSGRLWDVLLDGAAAGLLLLFLYIKEKIKKDKRAV